MAPDPFLPYVSRVPLSWADTQGPAAHWLEGTLVFVDVAGFTALSERLSRQGRAGAEELTDLLDGAFARLLSAAYEDGGSLLSFGGDALLLFFHGPDHQRRAAHAAGVIKRKPAELGPLQTSVGAVRLRLSMGAHSGRFLFLVTGEDSRLVLLLGPDATATVRLEQRATAGQVYLGPSLAAAVPEAAGEIDAGAALLLRTPRPPLSGDPEPTGDPLTPPSRFLSPPLREHIAAQPTSEHRRVAVGFVQVRGTDALLAQDTGTAMRALDEIVVTTQRAAAEYGVSLIGSDVDADGAKLILVAGAPKATEHEEERLLRVCRTVLDLDSPLSLRAGVTAGSVFVGDVGPAYRRAFTVMGERVNLAARLMGSAQPGELRTTPKVLAASATRFVTRQLEPLQLKGIKEPVQALAVGAPVGQVHTETGSGLHGRDDELRLLRTALQKGQAGAGSAVEVVGAPGAGKSALLAALLADAECPTLRVAAVPYEVETPYGLVKRILRHLLGVDAEADDREVGRRAAAALTALTAQDLALVLVAADAELDGDGPAIGPVVQDDLFLQRLSRAVRRALGVLVPGPACLVVEDLQWSDPSSTGLLRNVAEQLPETPWLLCTSRRPGGPASGKATLGRGEVISLEPLDTAAATDLVHALTADMPMTPHRVAALVARSGGNPLFLTQLVQTSRDSDELPESVEAVVNARLDALPTYLRKLLRHAAVLGAVFDLDLLGELAGFVPDRKEWRLLDGLLERQGSRGAFTSEMFRDVAYGSLLFRDRRALHRSAGRALATRGSTDVELLALHAALAHDDELTWRYGVEAGRRAQARGAAEQAVTTLRRALVAHERGHQGTDEQASAVYALLGDALVRSGQPQEALGAYRRARSLCALGPYGDPGLLLSEALARLNQGRHSAAARWFRRGLMAAQGLERRDVRQDLLAWSAGNSLRQGRYTTAIRTLEHILATTEGTDQVEANAHAHYLLHLVFTTIGDPRRALHRTQALAVYEANGDVSKQASVLNNLGMDAYYEGRWSEAVTLFDRSRLCEELDANDVGAAISDSNIAEVLSDQGAFDQAHTRLERALRTFLASDFGMGIATARYHLGRLETRRGRWEQAAQHLAVAREVVIGMEADSLIPDVVVREAELSVCQGLMDIASEQLDVLDTLPDVGSEMRVMAGRLRATIAARRGQDSEAERLLRAAIRGTSPFGAALAQHALAVLLARRHDAEAETHRQAALDALRGLGVHQFRDPLAGDDLIVIALPATVVDLTSVTRELAAV